LALYYANLRSFHYHLLPETWRNTVAFLNVFSVAAVMCSLGSRFIYPQLSLEGQGFWIIGMAPTSMTKVLVTKFALPVAGGVAERQAGIAPSRFTPSVGGVARAGDYPWPERRI
jgi:hypothetical protein